jgi:hypothetical protein
VICSVLYEYLRFPAAKIYLHAKQRPKFGVRPFSESDRAQVPNQSDLRRSTVSHNCVTKEYLASQSEYDPVSELHVSLSQSVL